MKGFTILIGNDSRNLAANTTNEELNAKYKTSQMSSSATPCSRLSAKEKKKLDKTSESHPRQFNTNNAHLNL